MAVLSLASSAQALSLITNGSFESASNGAGEFNRNTTVTGWSSTGYNFLFTSGSADTTGATGEFGNLKLWGPNDGSANGLPASSPDGGNFIAADGAFEIGAITQTINNLEIGAHYDVSFYWAGAQQQGFNGATTEQWRVFLGTEEHDTAVVNNVTHGFTGWQQTTLSFTATGTSEVLSFLAVGTPNGVPPFSLLDGVSMVDPPASAPEPDSMGLLLGGVMCGLGVIRFKRRRKS